MGELGVCALHIKTIVESRRPYPAWSENPPDPKRIRQVLEDTWPKLNAAFERLRTVRTDAQRQYQAARNKMIRNGSSVRLNGTIFNDVYSRINDAVKHIGWAVEADDCPELLLQLIGQIGRAHV